MTSPLIPQGLKLADNLEQAAKAYSEKSTAFECFAWQAVGIRYRIKDLKKGKVNTHKDDLINEWGSSLKPYSSTLAYEVSEFYKALYRFNAT